MSGRGLAEQVKVALGIQCSEREAHSSWLLALSQHESSHGCRPDFRGRVRPLRAWGVVVSHRGPLRRYDFQRTLRLFLTSPALLDADTLPGMIILVCSGIKALIPQWGHGPRSLRNTFQNKGCAAFVLSLDFFA